jgi:flagellar hook-basal body complex protein FliE
MLPITAPIHTTLTGLNGPAATGGGSKYAAGLTPGFTPGSTDTFPASGSTGQASPFSDLLTDAVGQVDQLESQARTAVSGLMSGSGVDVHQAMIATQKADMSFEMALAVRNKAVQAYQSVIGMQF